MKDVDKAGQGRRRTTMGKARPRRPAMGKQAEMKAAGLYDWAGKCKVKGCWL